MSTDKPIFMGWVLPDGTKLECAWGWHLDVAIAHGEKHPDEAGWLHFGYHFDKDLKQTIDCDAMSKMTRKQFDVMVGLYLEHGKPLPEWTQDVELTS